jgi:hypothetical protein
MMTTRKVPYSRVSVEIQRGLCSGKVSPLHKERLNHGHKKEGKKSDFGLYRMLRAELLHAKNAKQGHGAA